MDDSVMFELAERLKTLKEEKKQKELELRNISDMLTEIEAALAEFMTLNETPNFTHGDTSFSLRTSLKASAVSGKKEELYSSLNNAGYCPKNKFGSGENGSKACKNKHQMYFLREGEIFPMVLSLPTSSNREFSRYIKRLLSRGKKSDSVVTKCLAYL